MSDDNFASYFNKKKESEAGSDVNKNGIVDGSPESIKKMGQDFGDMLGGFFGGIMDGFSKYKPKAEPGVSVAPVVEPAPVAEVQANTSGPQVLNENK